jgi:oxygen-dependent protoporphyrinogen oxidase
MKISIIGGGISGLSAAFYARKKFPNAHISLFEASDRLGGWMQTKEVDGFSFELGPRTFQVSRCHLLLAMVQELGLDPVYSKSGDRFLWHQGALRKMQSFWPQLIWALIHDLFSPKELPEDESIYDFACRRCGKVAANLFFDPIAKGVFGGDIRQLSIRSCFPFLFTSKPLYKLFSGKKDQGLFTVRKGMGALIAALAKIPDEIHFHSSISEIQEGLTVVALPGQAASHLCGIPLELRNESMRVVNFGFCGDVLSKQGYGYLVPSMDGEAILGQIWDSSIFPTAGQTKVTTMVRGDDPLGLAIEALKRHVQIDQPIAALHQTEAQIPQYDLFHHQRIETFEAEVKKRFGGNVLLTGNYLHGASVEACVRRSLSLFSV